MRDDKSADDIEPAAIGLGIVFALLVIVTILRLL
jgi:hypothetical protein